MSQGLGQEIGQEAALDHWKVGSYERMETDLSMLEESSFSTLFPRYREHYIKEVWPHLTSLLEKRCSIAADLDLIQGSMTVRTTRKTWDPYIILKARDLIKLVSRGVPLNDAARILEDGAFAEVIKIASLVRNKERFVRRRQRLIGPTGNTLKAIELLTQCYVLVQGTTVSAIGPFKGLKEVRRIVIDCMNNVHPVYHIKELMIKRELAKDETLKNESWDRFLPKFRKHSQRMRSQVKEEATKEKAEPAPPPAKAVKKAKKAYSPFPPEQQPRKVDLEMESGEYWMKPAEKAKRKAEKRISAQAEKQVEKTKKKNSQYEAPAESDKKHTARSRKIQAENKKPSGPLYC